MAVELVRSAMEKRVGGWACEISDGEKGRRLAMEKGL